MAFADPEEDAKARALLEAAFADSAKEEGVPGAVGRGAPMVIAFHDWFRAELTAGRPKAEIVQAVGGLLGHVAATVARSLAPPGQVGELHGIISTEARLCGLRHIAQPPLGATTYHKGRMQ